MHVDLWIANLDPIPENPIEFLLAVQEQERAQKYVFDIDRYRFSARRTILRRLLSKYLKIDPLKIQLGYHQHGKPHCFTNGKRSLYFNVSHSKNMAVFGFSITGELGVDIEYIDSSVDASLISSHFFAKSEIEEINAHSGWEKADSFFRHWTIKEAFIKAVGKGLTFPLDHVVVTDVHNEVRLILPDGNYKDYEWTAKQISYGPEFHIAVAARSSELMITTHKYS